MKRLLDFLLVLLAAPFWLPLLLLVALAVLCALGRPVFFTQERAGLGGRPFRIVKFRSMRNGPGSDAERLTRFGRFLRASSLDEIPELLLVLAGRMSLVGPPPCRPPTCRAIRPNRPAATRSLPASPAGRR